MARKIGIIIGIIALILSFIGTIPIYPTENIEINFNIFKMNNVEYFLWGYVNIDNSSFSSMLLHFPESTIGILLWGLMLIIGLNSIMTSTSKTKYNNAIKANALNILFSAFLISFYTINIIILASGNLITDFGEVGLGYYLLIIILILNIVALKLLRNSEMIS